MTAPFTFRLALLGSRASLGRPIGTALGMAVGVAVLLLLLGGYLALEVREARSSWMTPAAPPAGAEPQTLTADTIAVAPVPVQPVIADGPRTGDYFDGRRVMRLDVAAAPGS